MGCICVVGYQYRLCNAPSRRLPLFAAGLGALGLLGWRSKRKNVAQVAAQLGGGVDLLS